MDPCNHEKTKLTILKKYGVECAFQIPEIKEQIKKCNLEKYGVEYVLLNKEKREDGIKTIIDKYGGLGFASPQIKEKYKKTMMNLYNVDWSFKSKEIWDDIYKKWKNKYRSSLLDPLHIRPSKYPPFDSKLEKDIYEKILINLFDPSNIIIHYKNDNVYPYYCDFYIKSLDLYIEIQGYYTHGKHPFDKSNKDDLDLLQTLINKNQKNYILCWTIVDVEKRLCAKQNNLNYLEIYSKNINEIKNVIQSYIKKE